MRIGILLWLQIWNRLSCAANESTQKESQATSNPDHRSTSGETFDAKQLSGVFEQVNREPRSLFSHPRLPLSPIRFASSSEPIEGRGPIWNS